MSTANGIAEWAIRRPILAVAGVVLVLALLLSRCGGGGREAGPSVATTPSTTNSTAPTTEVPSPPPSTSEPTSSADPEALRVGERFVRAWLSLSGTHAQWIAAMKPYTTPDLLKGLSLTDRQSVPDAVMAGDLEEMSSEPARWVFRVVLDDGSSVVVEVDTVRPGDDRVSSIEPGAAP